VPGFGVAEMTRMAKAFVQTPVMPARELHMPATLQARTLHGCRRSARSTTNSTLRSRTPIKKLLAAGGSVSDLHQIVVAESHAAVAVIRPRQTVELSTRDVVSLTKGVLLAA